MNCNLIGYVYTTRTLAYEMTMWLMQSLSAL